MKALTENEEANELMWSFYSGLLKSAVLSGTTPSDGDCISMLYQAKAVMYSAMRWVNSGNNTFKISHDLAASLILTEPPKKSPPLRLPHKALFVEIPPELIPSPFELSEWDWVTSLFLCEEVRENEDGSTRTMIAIESRGKGTGHSASYVWPAADTGEAVERAFREQFENGTMTVTGGALGSSLEHMQKCNVLCLRFVQNLLSWLDCSGSPPKRQAIPAVKRSSAKKHGWPTVWLVGGAVKISKELKDAAADMAYLQADSATTKEGWKLRMQHVVRGHWKLQSHGPKGSLRKKVWLEPYMRGPDGKVAWSHVYEAEQ
jgi:hypothetical protein